MLPVQRDEMKIGRYENDCAAAEAGAARRQARRIADNREQ